MHDDDSEIWRLGELSSKFDAHLNNFYTKDRVRTNETYQTDPTNK